MTKKIRYFLPLLLIFTLVGGCTHSIHMVHVSDFAPYAPLEGAKVVKAKSEQFAVMGFVFDTNYVDTAYKSLEEKCDGGRLQGITTQFSTSHGFFSWTNKILMQGFCVKS